MGRYQFPSLVSILSPVWGPDGSSVIFSGLAESGVSDLYRVRLPEGTLEHLTDDVYQDLDPSLSPDGTDWSSPRDRTAGGLEDAVNLFILDLATHAIRQLTAGPWADETPGGWPRTGFCSAPSRDGVLNAFSVDTLGDGRRETSAWTGAFDAAPVGDRDGGPGRRLPGSDARRVPLSGGFGGAAGAVLPRGTGAPQRLGVAAERPPRR